MKCKKCGEEIEYFSHKEVMQNYKTDMVGKPILDKKIDEIFTSIITNEYGECKECGTIYEFDSENNIMTDKILNDYPNRKIDGLDAVSDNYNKYLIKFNDTLGSTDEIVCIEHDNEKKAIAEVKDDNINIIWVVNLADLRHGDHI